MLACLLALLCTEPDQSQGWSRCIIMSYVTIYLSIFPISSFFSSFFLFLFFCFSFLFLVKIGECRSSVHVDGGKNPTWQNRAKSVFTFFVPATVTLDRLTLTVDVINENIISDGFIGTTGDIPVEQVQTMEDPRPIAQLRTMVGQGEFRHTI